ncbi:galactarate dehydratase [Natranaerovirga pectinivora]|uniref:Galactarate dehydratase n=1 Tax=Natranaerovirga pectinivora TaxID=682400 RepID=A0A4R3MEX7_9FIRM|nr:galactarate dehydratase [Natranaerovirga pectinivora]TCT12224.1 galactarate dehydratase [Natranaerovirga pectinivora]
MDSNHKKPLLIKVHPNDNVEVVVSPEGVLAGTVIYDNLTAIEDIPESHKIALIDFKAGDKIIRYDKIIGYANEPIPKGSWIDEHKLTLPVAPPLEELPVATKVPDPLPPLEGYTFLGYPNPDGSVGTKNMLGITTSVQCVEGILNIAVERIKKDLMPKYPNVDGLMPINHSYGCGVAIDAPEAKVPIRSLRNLATHPNFGGELLIIGLGCEKLMPEKLFPDIKEENVIILQNELGFNNMINRILEKAEEILIRLNKRVRKVCPVSELVVGLQCGGSDAFSGITANPAIGYAADLLVRCGATVMFSEVTEVRDGVHMITPRTINEEVGQKLKDEMAWYDNYLDDGSVDRAANTTPGNKQGGLANIVEKSLGSIVKSGTSAIVEVISPGEKPTKKGLIYAATPASDFVCGTCQLASGMTVQVFSTGRGTMYGLAMAPVIKVSSRTELVNKWKDLIDINAGKIATGESTIEEVGQEIFDFILEIASGTKKVWADHWGIENAICLFNPAPIT